MADAFTANIEALQSLHRFGDVYEDAIEIDAGPRPELNRAHRDAPLLR